MSAIKRQDVIADDVFQGLEQLQALLEKIIATGKQAGAKIQSGNTKGLTAETEKLTVAEKELAAVSAQVEKAKARQSDEYIQQQKELNKLRAEQKQLVQTEERELGTLEKLSRQNKELIKERSLLNLETENGRKKLQAINREIDKNNKVIRESSDALGRQKINIGNYASALESLPGPIGGIIMGIRAMTAASWQFIATPLGAIIGAIVIVVGALVSAFRTFDPLIDKIEQGIAALSAAFTVVKDAIVGLVTGTGSFKNLGSEMATAAKEAANLKKAQQDLDDQFKISEVNQAQYQNKIDQLLIQSKDLSKTEKERAELLAFAIALEKAAFGDRIALAEKDRQLWVEKFANAHRLTAAEIQLIQDRGVAALIQLQETKSFNAEEIDDYKEKLLKLETLQGEHQKIEEKAINRRNILIERQSEKEQKLREEREKAEIERAEHLRKELEDEIKLRKSINDNKFNAWAEEQEKAKERVDTLTELEQKLAKDIKSINEKAASDAEKLRQDELKKQQEARALQQEIIQQSVDSAKEIFQGFTNLRIEQIQSEMDKLEMARNRELEAAGDNARLKNDIDKKYDAKRRTLQKKQANAEKSNALFNIAINTAAAIVKALPNLVLAGLAATLGAAQAAFVASRKVPEFDKGTAFAPDKFIAGEKRPELMKHDGEWSLVDRPTLFTGHRGAKIVSGKETDSILGSLGDLGVNILKDKNALLGLLNNDLPERTKPENLRFVLEKNNKELIQAIQKKKEVSVNVNNRGARVRERSGNLTVDRINYYYGR